MNATIDRVVVDTVTRDTMRRIFATLHQLAPEALHAAMPRIVAGAWRRLVAGAPGAELRWHRAMALQIRCIADTLPRDAA